MDIIVSEPVKFLLGGGIHGDEKSIILITLLLEIVVQYNEFVYHCKSVKLCFLIDLIKLIGTLKTWYISATFATQNSVRYDWNDVFFVGTKVKLW